MGTDYLQRCLAEGCGRTFPLDHQIYNCVSCGELLEVRRTEGRLAAEELKRIFRERRTSARPEDQSGVWRYRELLPFEADAVERIVTLREGRCPILPAPLSAEYAGINSLRVKHLGWNPTGSFKDYGMTTAMTQALTLKATVVACASTGNTSASMAAYAARAGLKAVVFVPKGAVALGKLSQTLDYGATTIEIGGSFDQAMALVRELAEETELYLVNSINPFRIEGQKAIIFELLDELDWVVPGRIVVPGGNLGNSASFGKALGELHRDGFIAQIPRVDVVQAEGAAPFFATMASSDREELKAVPQPETLATAIRIGEPVSWKKARRTLEQTGGCCLKVSEDAIAEAKAVLGKDGIGCEPASATTLAAVKRLRSLPQSHPDHLSQDDDVVCILTGHQLKDPAYTIDYHSGTLRRKYGLSSQLANEIFQVPASTREIRRFLGL